MTVAHSDFEQGLLACSFMLGVRGRHLTATLKPRTPLGRKLAEALAGDDRNARARAIAPVLMRLQQELRGRMGAA